MALNVGQDFKQRWLTTPETVRQVFIEDLNRICDVLKPETNIQSWLSQEQTAQQVSATKIDKAYADLKAQLLEEARIRRQNALEKALLEKRAEQAEYDQQLLLDEKRQFIEQTQALTLLRQEINQEMQSYTAHYQKNPTSSSTKTANKASISDQQILSELESVRLRLELEAETIIEESVEAFQARLKNAAQEEIDLLLTNSRFSADQPPKAE